MYRLIFLIFVLPFFLLSCKSPDAVVNTNTGTLKLISPVNGNYYAGDTVNIIWQSSNIKAVNLLYLNNSLNTSYVIQNNIDANLHQYIWNIPAAVNYLFKIKIVDSDADAIYDESGLITPIKYQFSFPIDIGYTWTYKYYHWQWYHDGVEFDTTTEFGNHYWKVISKQINNDTTIYSVLCSIEDTVLYQHSIYSSVHHTSYDTVYTIKSEKTFPIIVTKDTVYCMWNKDPVIPAMQSRVNETKVPLYVISPSDTLKYSADEYPFDYQVIYINGIGLYKIYASWYSTTIPQWGTLKLIDYKIGN